MELADLTRDIRKTFLKSLKIVFFAKPGLSEFHKSSAEKKIRAFFLQSRTCLSFTRAAPKKHFLRA